MRAVNAELDKLEKDINAARDKHNEFLKELGLPPLPSTEKQRQTVLIRDN